MSIERDPEISEILDQQVLEQVAKAFDRVFKHVPFNAYREVVRFRRYLFNSASKGTGISQTQFDVFTFWLVKFDTGRVSQIPDLDLWNAIGPGAGKSPRRNLSPLTMFLHLDLYLLFCCPNQYLHLVRNALDLRLTEYLTETERRGGLTAARKWALTTCKRVWFDVNGTKPPKLPTRWWTRSEKRLARRLLRREPLR